MKRNTFPCSAALIFIFFLSCSPSVKKDPGTQGESFRPEPGKIYEKVISLSDPLITYALYTPTSYSEARQLPLILFFDPAAAGTFPVKKYRELAEKYQIILLGSNNSRNGLAQSETNRIFTTIMDDLHARYMYNKEFLIASGFSGGSRVAGIFGLYAGGFRGVIGCGAGLPLNDQQPPYTFNYFGIVGTADFNMWEMRDQSALPHFPAKNHELILFNGIHEWPPANVYETAILWQLIHAMDDTVIPDDQAIRTAYASTMKNLIGRGVVIKPSAADEKTRKKELDAQRTLQDAIFTKDISWWKEKISNLWRREGISPSDTLMNRRLLSYLGVLCYSFSERALKMRNLQALDHALMVYELVEPQNPEIPRLKGELQKMK